MPDHQSMAEQEEVFPRGGGRQLSSAAKKRLRDEGEAVALRDFTAEEKGKRRKRLAAVRPHGTPLSSAERRLQCA